MADQKECTRDIRNEIARLARRKDRRIVPRTRNMPCVWQPTTVTNPNTGIIFTDESAWHFIADLAESDHLIENLVLDQPPGEAAHFMTVCLGPGVPDLYIKVQLKRDMIFGRSFHYSTR